MKTKATALALLFLFGCSSIPLAPREIRKASFAEKITVKANTAYLRSLRWFDKNLRYVEGAGNIQEPSSGKMRMQARWGCNVFRKENDLKEYFLRFDLAFQTYPDSLSFQFSHLTMENAEGQPVLKPEAQLSDAAKVQTAKGCLKKMVAAVVKSVESTDLAW